MSGPSPGVHHHFGLADGAVAVAMNLLWGMNIVAIKFTVGATGPVTAAVVRLAAVFILCSPWLRPPRGRWLSLLAFGVVNGGLFLLFMNLALKVSVNVGALAIAGQLSAPIAILLGVVFLKEKVSLLRLAGVALAFAGVVLLLFDPRIVHELPGLALMTVAASWWAVSSLLQRRLAGVPIPTLYAWTGLMGVIVLAPLALAWERPALASLPHMPLSVIGWFAFSVLGSTLVGQGGMAWLLARHPVGAIMPLTLASPVVSVAASSLFFHIPITLSMVVGGAIAIVGVLLVTLAGPRARPDPEPV